MTVGFRVYVGHSRPPRSLVEQFAGLPPANIGDCMHRSRCMHPAIRFMGAPGGRLLGTAVTVRTAPGDNLMVHKAIEVAQPGDVIVVDAGGDLSHAIIGELMARDAQRRGIAGIVVDGAMRDVAGIRELGFPAYARGATPSGPFKEGPGEVNVTIACGGAVVEPGDILVGDEDGIVVVPQAEAVKILEAATAFHAAEEEKVRAIDEGRFKRPWLEKTLEQKGCELIVRTGGSQA